MQLTLLVFYTTASLDRQTKYRTSVLKQERWTGAGKGGILEGFEFFADPV